MDHNTNFNKLVQVEILQHMTSDQNGIKLEINNKKII